MKCTLLRLIHIRSFQDKSLEPDPYLTILTGDNGSGKTNLLEAIYCASFGKSFRTGNDSEMIQLGQDEGTILLHFVTHEIENEIRIRLSRTQGKKIFFNDTPVRRRELMGLFRTVLFTPDELQLIKGAPFFRRRFLNNEISQVSPRYYQEILRYTRAVQQRNAAFREARMTGKTADVDLWDVQIAHGACYIVKKRLETVEKMNRLMGKMESVLTHQSEVLSLSYKQQGTDVMHTDEEWFLEKLAASREEDARFCHTSIGPHRDDLQFFMNHRELSAYGSEGQIRTAVLALKLSEVQLIYDETGEFPVLLLDDVGSELDDRRRAALLDYVSSRKIQTFFTTTVFTGDKRGKEIHLE